MRKLIIGVEDSKLNRFILEEVGKILSVDMIVACDGKEGLKRINDTCDEGRPPDLIITDINMPEMSGIEVIQQLKQNDATKYIPVLVLTTESDFKVKIQGKNLGASGWILKPLDAEEVAEIIRKFLNIDFFKF